MNYLPLDKQPHWFCVEEGEKLIGTIAFFKEDDGWHAGRLALEPAYRGQHIGTRLVSYSFSEMFNKGVEEIIMELIIAYNAETKENNNIAAVLEKLGIETVGAAGETFDPNLHNAVFHVEDEALGEGEIVEVFQKGYKKGNKIIRFAMVKTAN